MPTLRDLAVALDAELHGPPDLSIRGVASLERARSGDLAVVDSVRFVALARQSRASALLVARGLDLTTQLPRLVTEHALAALNRVIEILGLGPRREAAGVHPTALVDPGAFVDPTASVGPYSVVGPQARLGARTRLGAHVIVEAGVTVGKDCIIDHGAVLHEGLIAGDRVRVGARAVLSRPGFGYAAGPTGAVHLHHIGRVVLEDDVHVGAGTTIDRARFDETRIARQSALDNLVHVGHNATIGPRTFIAAQTGLAGHAHVGADCEVGGQVGIGNDCGVGDRCRVAAKSGLIGRFGDGVTVLGYPALERGEALRMTAHLRRLARAARKTPSGTEP